MNLIVKELKRKYRDWNQRRLTEDDFHQFCDVNNIEVIEIPLRHGVKAILWFVEGEYVTTINSNLYGVQKLFAMWHEMGHFLLHSPNRTIGTYFWGDERIYSHQNRREEKEADVFALCALIPLCDVIKKTFDDLLDEGFTEKQISKRKEIYEAYKI